MTDENLLSRRQVIALLGGTGAAIAGGAGALNQDGSGGGNVYGGIMALDQAYQAGDRLWHGPLSARSEVPQNDGNAYIQTDAGSANDQYKIFHYDSDNGGWIARGFNTPAVTTDRIGDTLEEIVSPGDDVQGVLDSHDKRGVTVRFEDGQATYSSTITVGQLTKLVGQAALLDNQSGDEFDPRPMLTFDGVDGFQTPADATYRAQRPIWRELTLQGVNGATNAINLQANGNAGVANGKVGLALVDYCYFEGFDRGINGGLNADSLRVVNSHFMEMDQGIYNPKTECKIEGCIFWNMTGDSYCIFLNGDRSRVTGGEFEPNNPDIDCIFISAGSATISHNTFKGELARAISLGGGAGGTVISNNDFEGAKVKSAAVRVDAPNCIIENNHLGNVNFSETAAAIGIDLTANANYTHVSEFENSSAFGTANVRVQSGATECVIEGNFPSGVIDNGTRTLINGRGTNAGNPSTGGDWNGHADRAAQHNAVVLDTSSTTPYTRYAAQDDGAGGHEWVAVSTSAA